MLKRESKPVIGQVLEHGDSGAQLTVLGVVGNEEIGPGYANNAALAIREDLPKVAQRLSAIRIERGSVLLAGDLSFPPSPWPPEGWRAIGGVLTESARKAARKLRRSSAE